MLFRSLAAAVVLAAAGSALAQPVITSTLADCRPTAGGAFLLISGSGFGLTPTVLFDNISVSPLYLTSTSMMVVTPAGQGTRNVRVLNGSFSNTVLYTYDNPVVNAISPTTGPIAGQFEMLIGGNNFGISPIVTIGGQVATITFVDHTLLRVNVPAGLGIDQSVVVTVGSTSSTNGPKFSYLGPTIFGISTSSGVAGATVELQGINLGLAGNSQQPMVTVGGQTAAVGSVSPTAVQFAVPPGAGTNLPVVLMVAGQTASSPVAFSYSPPFINNATPSSGVTAGGYPMTIVGGNFGRPGQASVTIGGVAAPGTNTSNTSITVTVPPGQGINLPIVVTSGGQTSPLATTFSYNPPTITNIRPAFGPAQGGGPIIIDGQNFGTAASVLVGGQPATITSQSHTSIACIAPTRAGTSSAALPVQVRVNSLTSASGTYSYLCAADFNHSGSSTVQDIFDFLAAWFAGCP